MPGRSYRLTPDTLLGRVVATVLAIAVVALGFVLLTAAVILGGLLALVGIARLAWLRWRSGDEDRRGTIEVEYEVRRDDEPGRHSLDPHRRSVEEEDGFDER